MKDRNNFWLTAGILNLFTAFVHLIGGQTTLVNPMLQSPLDNQIKTEMLGVWHIVTIVLFFTSILFLRFGFKENKSSGKELLSNMSYLYLLFGGAFIIVSIMNQTLAPQWILLIPIGILGLIGIKKLPKINTTN